MRIVFMGTPDFAVPCLQALLDSPHTVTGVFTQPDKPQGRGYKLVAPPVKKLAMEHGIPVYQPTSLRKEEALEMLRECAPDLIVVVAYGKILPLSVLNLPAKGCINVHASLLPRYRGAGPIQWSILKGETVTGVTTMYMAEGLDTGDMLLSASIPIGEEETADELHDRLSQLGASVLLDTLDALEAGTLTPIPQDDSQSTYAPMLTRELSQLDFSKDARTIHNQIRGLSSWPAAQTTCQGRRLKVYRSRLVEGRGEPGTLLKDGRLVVACGEGAVELLEVQIEGGRRMAAADFLRGHPVKAGEKLGTV